MNRLQARIRHFFITLLLPYSPPFLYALSGLVGLALLIFIWSL